MGRDDLPGDANAPVRDPECSGVPASGHPADHDESLIDWFFLLTPAERLAELESRIAFFDLARRSGDTKLLSDSRGS